MALEVNIIAAVPSLMGKSMVCPCMSNLQQQKHCSLKPSTIQPPHRASASRTNLWAPPTLRDCPFCRKPEKLAPTCGASMWHLTMCTRMDWVEAYHIKSSSKHRICQLEDTTWYNQQSKLAQVRYEASHPTCHWLDVVMAKEPTTTARVVCIPRTSNTQITSHNGKWCACCLST